MAKKSCQEIITFFEELVKQANKTQFIEVFLWVRTADSSSDYDFMANDVPDMLYELRTAILREQMAMVEQEPPSADKTQH